MWERKGHESRRVSDEMRCEVWMYLVGTDSEWAINKTIYLK